MEYVKFSQCGIVEECRYPCDLRCVSCDFWLCVDHVKFCVQCEQPVCFMCYKGDLCCLQRPWGEKTKRHFEEFYQNKLVDMDGLNSLLYIIQRADGLKRMNFRNEAVERTVLHLVETFDAVGFQHVSRLPTKRFPKISKYVENEETRLKFLKFMEEILVQNELLFASIVRCSDDRDDILGLLDENIRSHFKVKKVLIECSLEENGKLLFDALKRRGLLDWETVKTSYPIGHVEGMKWIEQNGIDVVNSERDFFNFACYSPTEVLEYLVVEKGMTVKYMAKNAYIDLPMLKMIHKVKGLEEIQNFPVRLIWFNFDTVRFLRSIGYKFEKQAICRKNFSGEESYSLICCFEI